MGRRGGSANPVGRVNVLAQEKKGGIRALLHGRGRERLILAVINLAFAAWSTVVLAVILHLDPLHVLMANISAPVQYYAVLALLTGRRISMNAAILPLLWFGGGGLPFIGWSGFSVPEILSHLAMVAAALFILGESLSARAFRDLAWGLAIGTVAVVTIAGIILPWYYGFRSPVPGILREMGFPS